MLRIERTAREAIDRGAAFEALASCDRGLAYSPDDATLLALVRDAESGAARAPVVKPRRTWPWLVGALASVTAIGVIGSLRLAKAILLTIEYRQAASEGRLKDRP